jgi:predicted nucleic acid-binding protein
LSIVLDASAIAPVLIADEADDLLPGLTDKLAAGVVVPGHWRMEVVNLLLSAGRRGRLTDPDLADARETLASIVVTIDSFTDDKLTTATWQLASRHSLSIYDAAYLELAARLNLPLASADRRLLAAADRAGVARFGR